MVGKIYFLLVRIKIKHMEIAIIKKETSGTREKPHSFPFLSPLPSPLPPTAPNIYTENEQIAKFEIMDGAPVRGNHGNGWHGNCNIPISCAGESIPIRLFLAGYDLTPTMRDINKKFSVRYYLNLVLVDEEERRYFKQQVSSAAGSSQAPPTMTPPPPMQEIVLWRKGDPKAVRKAAT